MKHNTAHERDFPIYDHEFVIDYDDIGMLDASRFNPHGYSHKAQLTPEVTQWLEDHDIRYFVRPGFFNFHLLFNGDADATLFKLTWGM